MKKFLCLLLALLLVLPLAVACNNEENPPVSTGDNVSDSGDGSDDPTPGHAHNVPVDELDFGNEEVAITAFPWGVYTYYFFAEEESSDPMQSAIYNRRRTVEEAIGVKIKEIMQAGVNEAYAAMDQAVSVADDSIQIALIADIMGVSTYTGNGSLYPIEELPHVDLTADWWNQEQMENLKLGSHYLLASNDYMIPSPYVIFFNKEIITDLNLESPYDLVLEQKWTLDKLEELGRAASRDADNNGIYDQNDTYGLSCGTSAAFASFWGGCDQFMAYKGDDGKLKVFENNEKAINLCETLAEWTNEHITCPFPTKNDSSAVHLKTGNVLFWLYPLSGAEQLRDSDIDYGILPYPKYDEAQKDYCTIDRSGFMTVLTTIENPAAVGATIELLAFESADTVIPAYYDIVLDGQLSQDPTTPKMLDILFDTINYDPGIAYWGLSGSFQQMLYYLWSTATLTGRSDFASFHASNAPSAQRQIDNFYTQIALYDNLEDLFG